MKKETAEDLLAMADIDFISILVLWDAGVQPGSTYGWLFAHSIEKYLKAYLLKQDKDINDGHKINNLWEKFKKINTEITGKPEFNKQLDVLIERLTPYSHPKFRYSQYIEFLDDKLSYSYIVFCSLIRYLIIGKKNYRENFYGLKHRMPVYKKESIEKMLHLSLEHGVGFTFLGFMNTMNFKELSISNTSLLKKGKRKDCPFCNKKSISQKEALKFYRNI